METVSNEVRLFVGKYTFIKSKSKYSPTNIKSKRNKGWYLSKEIKNNRGIEIHTSLY